MNDFKLKSPTKFYAEPPRLMRGSWSRAVKNGECTPDEAPEDFVKSQFFLTEEAELPF